MLKIKRQDLVSAFNLLKPGLSSEDIIEEGMCFNFHKDTIVTFNDIISVSVPLETGIEGAVRAEEFYKLIDRLTTDEIELTRTENELRLKAGKIRAGLAIRDKTLPPLCPQSAWKEIPTHFKEAVKFCQFSTGRDATRPHLTCIHIRGTKVFSSDNWRITQFITNDVSPYDFLEVQGDHVEKVAAELRQLGFRARAT